jgi:peptidoglycan/xylan/chitin deacetylase (PgdA/CDA1 family)
MRCTKNPRLKNRGIAMCAERALGINFEHIGILLRTLHTCFLPFSYKRAREFVAEYTETVREFDEDPDVTDYMINSYLEDIKGISDVVYKKTGIRSNIIRFPGGSSNVISKNYCSGIMTDLTTRMSKLGYSYFDWNVVSGDADAVSVPATTIANNVLTRAEGQNSICVLMHDTSAKTTTVDALPPIIEGLQKMGFRFKVLKAENFGFHQKVNN